MDFIIGDSEDIPRSAALFDKSFIGEPFSWEYGDSLIKVLDCRSFFGLSGSGVAAICLENANVVLVLAMVDLLEDLRQTFEASGVSGTTSQFLDDISIFENSLKIFVKFSAACFCLLLNILKE